MQPAFSSIATFFITAKWRSGVELVVSICSRKRARSRQRSALSYLDDALVGAHIHMMGALHDSSVAVGLRGCGPARRCGSLQPFTHTTRFRSTAFRTGLMVIHVLHADTAVLGMDTNELQPSDAGPIPNFDNQATMHQLLLLARRAIRTPARIPIFAIRNQRIRRSN